MFEKFSDLKESALLASVVGLSVAREGEGPSSGTQPWKHVSEYRLWDESDDSLQILSGAPGHDNNDDDNESDEEDMYVMN